jgi:transposase
MKTNREIMEILEAYDLTGSYRAAAQLAGCDHHTVARYVALRAAGGGVPVRLGEQRARPIDAFVPKIEELVVRSNGKIRADVVHKKIKAMGFAGSGRTTRRAVAGAKKRLAEGQRRVFRPWIAEPGLWLQWDWGTGPLIGNRQTLLWCAWLAWSRYRVVIPVWDKALPTVVSCLDITLRRLGGVPTYALTDNEKTVSTDHIAGIAVRNPDAVAAARHYGMTIRTCVVADPQTKGGSEATVRIAKADLVPTATNLLERYRTFSELEAACKAFCAEVNEREHRETRRRPIEALAEERTRLHRLPTEPFTVAFGTTRRVNWDSTVSVEGVRYSVPHTLADSRVWVRFHGDELIVTSATQTGAIEVARHQRCSPGNPSIKDEHYPLRPDHHGQRPPKPASAEEAAFLALGDGAAAWLTEAAATGVRRIRPKMAEAVTLAKLHPVTEVDRALGIAAIAGRFGENDLIAILTHNLGREHAEPTRAGEDHSLQPGTSAWSQFGISTTTTTSESEN